MEAWAAFLASLLDLGLRLLEKADADRAAEFRRRVADDGARVLLGQLNPGRPESASVDKLSTVGTEQNAGRMDEQR